MTFEFKFICVKSYDFIDENENHVFGSNCYCYDEKSNNIIKAKVKTNRCEQYSFGDIIEVTAVPSGRFLNYEV